MLLDALFLPKTCRILQAQLDFNGDMVSFLVEDPGLNPVPEWKPAPIVNPCIGLENGEPTFLGWNQPKTHSDKLDQ